MKRNGRYIRKEDLEASSLALLADYGRKFGAIFRPPVPAEEIIESHFGLDFRFVDLLAELEDPNALGATWVRRRLVKIDQSLDPSVYPHRLGRCRFTVAHEIGHWDLHRHLFLSREGQEFLFASNEEPIVCRSNDKSPLEWQADCFAGHLLMPKAMVFAQWEAMHGSREPYIAVDEIAGLKVRWGLGEDERPTVEVARQMASLFQVSAQAMQIRLIDLGLIRTHVPDPKLFS